LAEPRPTEFHLIQPGVFLRSVGVEGIEVGERKDRFEQFLVEFSL